MKRWLVGILGLLLFVGCRRYSGDPGSGQGNMAVETATEEDQEIKVPEKEERRKLKSSESKEEKEFQAEETKEEGFAASTEEDIREIGNLQAKNITDDRVNKGEGTVIPVRERIPVKVKGIYVSAYAAGTSSVMERILEKLEVTELNAVVIDVKDDNGNVTFQMDSPGVQEIGACVNYIPDIKALMGELKERGIYCIARIPAFRDPFLAEVRPEWCFKRADGTVFRDRNNLAWVNPYKREVWEYLLEIAREAGKAGFDEIQFDYIRFCTEKGMDQVVFDEEDTEGKSRQEIISEFTGYVSGKLREEGLFVSADVFGAVIDSEADGQAVGQDYREMARKLDYICPMVYPSHYGNGNFGIPYPDTRPYETVYRALTNSGEVLAAEGEDGEESFGKVRPWLQDFTASYLSHHIRYGPKEVREQIRAVYDAGYEEWILWSASVNYHYDGLLSPREAQAEEAERRAEKEALGETSEGKDGD